MQPNNAACLSAEKADGQYPHWIPNFEPKLLSHNYVARTSNSATELMSLS